MDQIIEKYPFDHSSSDDQRVQLLRDLEKYLQHCDTVDLKILSEQATKSLTVLKEKLSRPDFPNDMSDAYFMSSYVYKDVQSLVQDITERAKKKLGSSSEDFIKELNATTSQCAFDILLCCFNNGPCGGHIELIRQHLLTSSASIKLIEFIQKLSSGSKQLTALWKCLKRDYIPKDQEEKTRWLSYVKLITGIIIEKYLPEDGKSILVKHHQEIYDLYSYCLDMATYEDEAIALVHYGIVRAIQVKFTEGGASYLFMDMPEKSLVMDQLNRIKKLITIPGCLPHSTSHNAVEKTLTCICKAISNDTKGIQVAPLIVIILQTCFNETLVQISSNVVAQFRKCNKDMLKRQKDQVLKVVGDTFVPLIQKNKTLVKKQFDTLRYLLDVLVPTIWSEAKDSKYMLPLLRVLVTLEELYILRETKSILRDKAKYIKWKDHREEAKLLASELCSAVVTDFVQNGKHWREADCLRDICVEFLNQTKKLDDKDINCYFIDLILFMLQKDSVCLFNIMSDIMEHINFKTDGAKLRALFEKVVLLVEKWQGNTDDDCSVECPPHHYIVTNLLRILIDYLCEMEDAELYSFYLSKVLTLIKEGPFECDSGTPTHVSLLAQFPMMFVVKKVHNVTAVEPLLPAVFELCQCSNPEIKKYTLDLAFVAFFQNPAILHDHIDRCFDLLEENDHHLIINCLNQMYDGNVNRKAFHSKIDRIFNYIESGEVAYQISLLGLLTKIAEYGSENITAKHLSQLEDILSKPQLVATVLNFLSILAKNNTRIVKDKRKLLYDVLQRDRKLLGNCMDIITCVAIKEQDIIEEVIKMAFQLHSNPGYTVADKEILLAHVRTLAFQNPDTLLPFKATITMLGEIPELKESSANLLDMIEGRTLKGLETSIQDNTVAIGHIKTDVLETSHRVDNVQNQVNQNQEDMNHLKTETALTVDKVAGLQEQVDQTVEKVEEIDHKTMTNAPTWSRDVSKLLNPESANDWRLLALRLGYTPVDIRGWGTQSDPCMALLSEWYATHKTSEATHAILKGVEEINREDVAVIIRKSLEDIKGIAVDTDDIKQSGPLPPVFLSYQWGIQEKVKLLKNHLEGAGFRCWMDLGQMGGGDKLFQKIDMGMRSSKIVVSCVTEKYAKSDNCNREVNLAVTLGKPIIPLLMEKMSWPPEGSMGPIFGEFLFIRFFQRSGEKANDGCSWPVAKLDELLVQLRYHCVPDKGIITKEYQNWWIPKEQRASSKTNSSSAVQSKSKTTPQIFISYQWGKQPHIKALFDQLTSMGYTCWLDIYEMGGGNSLFDTIDKGIRGCKVVISCVTPKYAISANCRRELSLADAIKKPIIPIILEELSWPPDGPMGMVFTSLKLVNFSNTHKIEEIWAGPEFDQLLEMVKEVIPEVELRKDEQQLHARNKWKEVENVSKATVAFKQGNSSQSCCIL